MFKKYIKKLNKMTSIEFKNKVQKESKPLKHYAYQLTRNVEDSNDLVQETMLKAFTYQHKFEAGTNLKGWLYTIMKNTFINNYRRLVKRNTFIDQTDNDYYLDQVSHLIKNEGEQKFIRQDIEKAINKLPLNLSKPFTMNFKGFKYHEIAEILHIPIGTVKTRIFVARRALRQELYIYGKIYGLESV